MTIPKGLYALCDDGIRPELCLVLKAQALIRAGVRVLQLRIKQMGPRDALSRIRAISALCREANALCLVNDRVDLALLGGAHGVHVGDEDVPAEAARVILGPHAVVGVTVRDLAGAVAARASGAQYVGLGPVFPTRTKQVPHAPLGLPRVAEIARASPLPVVAIAGIDEGNIGEVAATGVHGAAVLSDLYRGDVEARARRLAEAFARGA